MTNMAANYWNEENRSHIVGFNFTKRYAQSSVYVQDIYEPESHNMGGHHWTI